MHKLKIYIFEVAILTLLSSSPFLASSKAIGNSSLSFHRGAGHTGSEYLDGEQKFKLSWTINEDEKTIYFEVSAETLGYVGFGLSPNGGMAGADILIAGVTENGETYSGVSSIKLEVL